MATSTSGHIAQTPTIIKHIRFQIETEGPGLRSLEVSRMNCLREHQRQPAGIQETERAEIQSGLIHHHCIHKYHASGQYCSPYPCMAACVVLVCLAMAAKQAF